MKTRPKSLRNRFRGRTGARRARRGIALFATMFFVFGIGALALSAIYLTANASLISKTYEKEDDLKYASEAALAIGKAELNFNPAALPNTSYVSLLRNKVLMAADNQLINGVTVNLYAGPTGSASGQFGRFASLVAEARDASGAGFVRRLELTQESFAKYAYWSNSETNSGSTIFFANGDQLWGPVWSNDNLNIGSTGASFHDAVGTAGVINGVSYGTFAKGYQLHQRPITLPSLSSLSGLSALAAAGGMSLTATTTGNENTVLTRIEFVAADMDGNLDSLGPSEGFFRQYTAKTAKQSWLRGDWPGTMTALPNGKSVLNCGDWHKDATGVLKFFPFAVHAHPGSGPTYTNTWYDTLVAGGLSGGVTAANVAAIHAEGDSVMDVTKFSKLLLDHPSRCYLGGDPHLAAVARDAGHGYTLAKMHIGGTDTTFTPADSLGAWKLYTATPNGNIALKRPNDAGYLFPLYRGYNTGTKGVIYVNGTVGISGVVNGTITLYTPNTIVLLDDIRYANDPAAGRCVDMLGVIAGANAIVANNGLNTPVWVKTGTTATTATAKSMDDTPDLYLHSVIMALGTSFQVEDYDTGPVNSIGCSGSTDGRGCLYLTGGLIQANRGAVGTGSGSGYVKRYSYDRCVITNPPPYFPTTGRFQDNRYYELDPVRFDVTKLFHDLGG
jgi:hypothetical protein